MAQNITATDSAQDSELTTVTTWFELDVIHSAVDEDTKSDVAEVMNKAVNQPDTKIEVSWWDIDGWVQAVDHSNEQACEILSRLSDKAQN